MTPSTVDAPQTSDFIDVAANYERTRQAVGYLPRAQATADTYQQLGFKCGLEVHQQLDSPRKLFCHCPTGIYQDPDDFDAEVIRHMRPTLSELGEYDGTALMEFKTRKEIVYRIKNETACTYDIDDTPPFPLDPQALDIAIEIALMLKLNVVGELHISRKQYLDGSIPTGFQRTAIVGIEGEFPLPHKKVRIIQMSIEEDSCREVSDVAHRRIYRTDRLGMPLIETVTYPDLLTPDEAAQAAHYLRFVARASGKVRTGIGAAREDVNVSIEGGTRVEIKGVAHIRWIPDLTHHEAFRQKALLQIRDILRERVPDEASWRAQHIPLDDQILLARIGRETEPEARMVAINLPQFRGLLSYFTAPGRMFADELADRLKVIACLEHPNLIHTEQLEPDLTAAQWQSIRDVLQAGPDDAQLVVWGNPDDLTTAVETIDERCRLAMHGVPNETRKSLPDGTTIFERVLPGPDRMYPDTDSAPISIDEERIDAIRKHIAPEVAHRARQLHAWGVPADTHAYLLRQSRVGLIEQAAGFGFNPAFIGGILGHTVRHLEGTTGNTDRIADDQLLELFRFVADRKLDRAVIRPLLGAIWDNEALEFDRALEEIGYRPESPDTVLARIPALRDQFRSQRTSAAPGAAWRWIMGQLWPHACGNISMRELGAEVERAIDND